MRRSLCCLALLACGFLCCGQLAAQVTECGPAFVIDNVAHQIIKYLKSPNNQSRAAAHGTYSVAVEDVDVVDEAVEDVDDPRAEREEGVRRRRPVEGRRNFSGKIGADRWIKRAVIDQTLQLLHGRHPPIIVARIPFGIHGIDPDTRRLVPRTNRVDAM